MTIAVYILISLGILAFIAASIQVYIWDGQSRDTHLEDWSQVNVLRPGEEVFYDPYKRQMITVSPGEAFVPMKKDSADPTCKYCGQSLYTEHCGAHPKKDRPEPGWKGRLTKPTPPPCREAFR